MKRSLVLFSLVVVIGLLMLQVRPLRMPIGDPQAQPALQLRESGHAVLLIVEPSLWRGETPPRDLEWSNILRQAFGGCDVRSVEELRSDPPTMLESRRIVVFPRQTLATLVTDDLEPVKPHVARGASVILECPTGEIASAFGLESTGAGQRPQLIWPHPRVGAALRAQDALPPPRPLLLSHAVVNMRPSRATGLRPRPSLSPAGRPLVWTLPQERGAWILHTLDLGDLANRIRQGESSREAGPTADLAAVDALTSAEEPWLDRWVDALLDPDSSTAPWPRLWPVAPEYDGWLLISQQGDDLEGDVDTRFSSRRDDDGAGLLGVWPDGEGDAEAPFAPHILGWGPLRLGVRPLGLAAQAEDFVASPTLHRNRLWRWPADAELGWRWLLGAGFWADSSYGPRPGSAGWCFGTSLPFRPLHRGVILPLWEIPAHWRGTSDELDLRRVARWLRRNAEGSHGAVHLAIDGPLAPDQLEALRRLAAESGHAFDSASNLLRLQEARESRVLNWEFGGQTLRVEARPASDDQPPVGVAVPKNWGGWHLVAWRASWSRPEVRRSISFGQETLVAALPPGGGAISFRYRKR